MVRTHPWVTLVVGLLLVAVVLLVWLGVIG
jgi:hypothetical protein